MTTHPSSASLAMLLLALVSPVPASGQAPASDHTPRPGFDPSTGRDLLNFPPHRVVDILHQRIELTIPDMNVPHATARTIIRVSPIAADVREFTLNAAELDIRTVACDGRQASFTADPGDGDLRLTFDPPIARGQTADVSIDYEILNPPDGLRWSPESPHRPGQPASLYTQGQAELNRYWFPTHDFPNERFTSEVIVTLPSGYTAVSNGRLIARERATFPGASPPAPAAERFHYALDREHAPYLVSLAVGRWDAVEVGPSGDRLPMPVYLPPGQRDRARAVFGRTPRMLTLFERLFGEPYPWPKYAQVVTPGLSWGGMENTSATHLGDDVLFDHAAAMDGDQDALIAHELAHQWFGNLLTCRSWEHIWLNEGWATYAEALWEQYKDARLPNGAAADAAGPARSMKPDDDAYQFAVWTFAQSVLDTDRGTCPHEVGMASKAYAFPDAVFDRSADPYAKGAMTLHMLRTLLGEAVFWRGIGLYIDRHKDAPVETHHFRLCMEEVSGLSLQRFFEQWTRRPGVPRLRVSSSWNSESRTLAITVDQTQPIDGANPAFAFDLPMRIDEGSGRPRSVTVACDGRSTTAEFTLDREPRGLIVDPDLRVLAEIVVNEPTAASIRTLTEGPTLAARLSAARRLGEQPTQPGIDALAQTARDQRAYRGLRVEAAKSLARLGADPGVGPAAAAAILDLARAPTDDPAVRREIASAAGAAGLSADPQTGAQLTAWLLECWSDDPSPAVRAEALRSLGSLKAVDAMPVMAEALATASHADAIRVGALDALARSRFPDALDQAITMTLPSRSHQARVAAIRAVAALAPADPERAFNILSALVNDDEYNTRRAAVEAMLTLPDPRARLTVEQWADAARSRADRLWALDLLERTARTEPAPAP